MNRIMLKVITGAVAGVVAAGAPARAETLLVPWLGVNTGTRNVSSAIDFGASVGTTAAGGIGLDFDLGYSPDDTSNNPFSQFDLANLHYWRTSFGFVLR